jgi:hypothetical protein
MNPRKLLAIVTLPAAFSIAACASSTTNGSGSTGGPSGGTTVGPSGAPTDAQGLSALLERASNTVKTAHIDLKVDAAGQQIAGSGDESLNEGVLTGLNITESLPGDAGSLQLIIADGKTYAKLPSSINPSDKPWVLITSDSTNPTIQQLSTSISQTQESASIGSTTAFVTAAKSVENKGTEDVNGEPATHYSVVVDTTKLPADNTGKEALIQAGVTSLPVELYIDSQGRPVKLTENFSAQGQAISTEVDLSKYDQPVTIEAPPADQVGTP